MYEYDDNFNDFNNFDNNNFNNNNFVGREPWSITGGFFPRRFNPYYPYYPYRPFPLSISPFSILSFSVDAADAFIINYY